MGDVLKRVRQLPLLAMRRRRTTLFLAVVVVLASAPGVAFLRLQTDGHALVAADEPAVLTDARVRAKFGVVDPLVVIIETTHPDGIYNAGTLRRIRDLSDELLLLEGVSTEDVVSLSTEMSFRVRPGTFEFLKFLEPPQSTAAEILELRNHIEMLEIISGTLVSVDEKAAAILVGLRPGRDRAAWCQRIKEVGARHVSATDRVVVVGAPAAEALLGIHVLEDLAFLVPLAMIITLAILWVGCRRLACALIAFVEIGACLIVTFGVMGWAGSPVYITTIILPVILTAMGLADEIHLLWDYQHRLAQHDQTSQRSSTGDQDPPAKTSSSESGQNATSRVIARTMHELARPVALTSLTTSAGFLGFMTSSIPAVRSFGLYAALAIILCMTWSLTVVPAMLVFVPASWMQRRGRRVVGDPAPRKMRVGSRRPLLSRIALVGILALGLLGIPRLEVQDSWIGGFSPGSPFRKAMERADESFHGMHILLVCVEFSTYQRTPPSVEDRSGFILDPEYLRAVRTFEHSISRLEGVGGVLGPYSQLLATTTIAKTYPEKAEELLRQPVGLLHTVQRFERIRGLKRRREVLDDDLNSGLVTVFMKDPNFKDTERILSHIDEEAQRLFAPLGGRVEYAGGIAVSQAMIPAIVHSQLASVGFGLVAVTLLLAIGIRSFRSAILVVLGPLTVTASILGWMGHTGVPLGVATSMFGAIIMGVGVDHGIHLFSAARRAGPAASPQRIAESTARAIPAIIADALAVGLGFLALSASNVPVTARLGTLVALSLLLAGGFAILILRPLMIRSSR